MLIMPTNVIANSVIIFGQIMLFEMQCTRKKFNKILYITLKYLYSSADVRLKGNTMY